MASIEMVEQWVIIWLYSALYEYIYIYIYIFIYIYGYTTIDIKDTCGPGDIYIHHCVMSWSKQRDGNLPTGARISIVSIPQSPGPAMVRFRYRFLWA